MHNPALEQTLGLYRPKTRYPQRPVRPFALHVLLCVIKDLLGTRL